MIIFTIKHNNSYSVLMMCQFFVHSSASIQILSDTKALCHNDLWPVNPLTEAAADDNRSWLFSLYEILLRTLYVF